MKSLLFASSLAIVSQFTQANEIVSIDIASNQMNIESLQTISEQTQGYEHAYAEYRLAVAANAMGQRTTAQTALDTAEQTLVTLTTRQADAETYTLLASVYGMQIGLDSSKGAHYGPLIAQAIEQAESLNPDNPRLALVKAISAYSTPTQYGGSMERAITLSSKAINLFEIPCDDICWGYAEAYTWRGLAKQNLGDKQGAITDWQAALAVQQDYAWANFLLKQNQ
ncbi:hypothetical protein [Shewanella colwelliana]|uniref:hypothetical protein n=1 Tax=Shewanella colwelliana TaxID=23 RepID=UPI000490C049|nr:hypothetical protein [Shewanella colwelliana]